jgi:hypothetical protein
LALRPLRLARTLTAVAVALTAIAGPLAAAVPAHAAEVQSPKWFSRKAVIERALTWTSKGIPYSQTAWYRGYRTDCSGFVSMAWGLDQSYVTWSLPEVAVPITKEQLQPGDIMLDTVEHVVIFGAWTDKTHTSYWCYEQAGSTDKAVRHVVPWPFRVGGNYRPYRYTGGHTVDGHNLFSPFSRRVDPLIQTYAGGAPLVPSDAQRARVQQAQAIKARQARWEAAAKAHYAKVAAQKKAAAAQARAKAAKAAAAKKAASAAAAKSPAPARPGLVTPPSDASRRGVVPHEPADTRTVTVGDEPVIVTILRAVVGWIVR